MPERETPDPYETPGSAAPGNPYQPPSSPAPSGFEWRWVPSVGQWQLVRTSAGTTTSTTTSGTTLADLTREQRDALTRGTAGNLEGFMNRESYGGDVKARTSVKNMFATIASRYPSKPSSIDKILADADFKRLFPNARKASFDSIDFGGVKSDFETGSPVGIVDVLTAADPQTDTARGWWWGYYGNQPTTYKPPSQTTASMSGGAGANDYGVTAPTRTTAEGGGVGSTMYPQSGSQSTPGGMPDRVDPSEYTPFTGAYADLTPEEIYRRNAGREVDGVWTPYKPSWEGDPYAGSRFGGQYQGAPSSPNFQQSSLAFGSPLAVPAVTLGTLARGIRSVFTAPRGRRVTGRL